MFKNNKMAIKNKFNIGDKVKVSNDGEIGEVVAFFYDPERGFTYKISSKEIDVAAKEIIEGFKTVNEKELEKSKKDE